MKLWLPHALAVRDACTAVVMVEGALAKLAGEDASPARLEEVREVVSSRQEACRAALLELLADCQEELAALPAPAERVAGEFERGSGV